MNILSFEQVGQVSGGFNAGNVSYFMDKTLAYGATGVLAQTLLHGVSLASGLHGFAVGASVGAAYAGVTILAYSLGLY